LYDYSAVQLIKRLKQLLVFDTSFGEIKSITKNNYGAYKLNTDKQKL